MDTAASLGLFLLNFPDGLREYDARERAWHWLETAAERRALARRAIVEGDFNAAFETGTVAAWDAWLAQYPAGRPRPPTRKRAREEAAQFELAAKVNTKVMWRAFLKAWPATAGTARRGAATLRRGLTHSRRPPDPRPLRIGDRTERVLVVRDDETPAGPEERQMS